MIPKSYICEYFSETETMITMIEIMIENVEGGVIGRGIEIEIGIVLEMRETMVERETGIVRGKGRDESGRDETEIGTEEGAGVGQGAGAGTTVSVMVIVTTGIIGGGIAEVQVPRDALMGLKAKRRERRRRQRKRAKTMELTIQIPKLQSRTAYGHPLVSSL